MFGSLGYFFYWLTTIWQSYHSKNKSHQVAIFWGLCSQYRQRLSKPSGSLLLCPPLGIGLTQRSLTFKEFVGLIFELLRLWHLNGDRRHFGQFIGDFCRHLSDDFVVVLRRRWGCDEWLCVFEGVNVCLHKIGHPNRLTKERHGRRYRADRSAAAVFQPWTP